MYLHALIENTHFKHSKLVFDDIEERHNGVNNGSNASIQSSFCCLYCMFHCLACIIKGGYNNESIAVQRTSNKCKIAVT